MDIAKFNEIIVHDRADLLALLSLRFRFDVSVWKEAIERVKDGDFLQRMILVAANAPQFSAFEEEWKAGPSRFRIDQQPMTRDGKGTRKEG